MPQEVADGGAPCPSAMIHVRAGLSGCLSESAQAVGAAYSQFLRALVQILRESLPFLHPGAAGGAAAEARQRLALAALKACTLDHGAFADHAVLDASGLLPTLEGYLAVPDPTLRAAVWALLESLLDRAGPEPAAAALAAHHHDADAAERFHGQLLGLMFRLLGRTAGAGSAGGGRSVAASDTRWALSRATVGPVIPYARLTLGTTFAFWLFRPAAASGSGPGGREQAGRQPKLLKPGDRIVRGPDWCDGEENGWVGAVGTVRMMETPTAVIVEWDGMREDQFIYRYAFICLFWTLVGMGWSCDDLSTQNAPSYSRARNRWGAVVDGRKVYDLEIVRDQGAGGLLLFKGTESLAGAATTTTTPADGEQEDDAPAEPWSALGLSLTETFRLLFRTCTAGEGLRAPTTFAVLTNRPLPCGEWVHVACDISQVGD